MFPRPPALSAIDSNEDGEISGPEMAEAPRALLALDKNDDGQVAEDELRMTFPGGPPFGGPGGPGGMTGSTRKLVSQFDANGDNRLDAGERAAAREASPSQRGFGGRGGFGPPDFGRGPGAGAGAGREAPAAGRRVSPADVVAHPDAPLYDPGVFRTIFLDFENDDWEQELAAFKGSDVEVPATLTVDGKEYPGVGVHFRGMSSYMMVPAGYKRSLNVSLDFTDPSQRLYGYKTLNLLNCSGDPSFLSSALYSHIARKLIPAPQANLMHVVINGESWGVFSNVQQFDKIFLEENFKSADGVRWKVSGNPGGGGGLEYLGDKLDDYKRRYELKGPDAEQAWRDLVNLCRTLNETPADQLEQAIAPLVDVDGLLRFLALDVVLCNSDGYWVRASDYTMYQDPQGVFHFIPHDMNEAFNTAAGPGGRGRRGRGEGSDRAPVATERTDGATPRGFGPPGVFADPPFVEDAPPPFARRDGEPQGQGSRPAGFGPPGFGPPGFGPGGPGPGGPPGFGHGGVDLDPLVALDDPRKPLRSKVLAVPALRAKYLQYVRQIAEELQWEKFGLVVAQYRALIGDAVEADTRKLTSNEAFQQATADASQPQDSPAAGLRSFAEKRRDYLLSYSESDTADSAERLADNRQAPGGGRADRSANRPFGFGAPRFALADALDNNGDATLSREEIDNAPDALRSIDEDNDGKLNPQEIGWPPFARGGFAGFGPPGGGFPGFSPREFPQAGPSTP